MGRFPAVPKLAAVGTLSQHRRRTLLLAAGAIVGAPLAFAQTTKHARVGVLHSWARQAPIGMRRLASGMRELGWVEGRNITIEWRFGDGDMERAQLLASELVNLRMDVLVASSTADPEILQQATRSIPIVAWYCYEPVLSGLAQSIARPGGNVTGVIFGDERLLSKSTELLIEILPRAKRVAALYPIVRAAEPYYDSLAAACRRFGITLLRFPIRRIDEVPPALASAKRQRADVLRLANYGAVGEAVEDIVAFAIANRIPLVSSADYPVERGALMSYAPAASAIDPIVYSMVDRILKGEKPAEMPFQYPTKLELVINLKTAKKLGITVSPSILARVDRLIE